MWLLLKRRGWRRTRTVRRLGILIISGLVSIAVPDVVLAMPRGAAEARPSPDPVDDFVALAARRFGIPGPWIRAVMRTESAGDARAVSRKGAMGLMQIMPATWADLRVRHALGADPFDPRDNILAGTAYLRELYDRYGAPGFLAAYNAGPGRYEASLNGGALPAETIAYVETLGPAVDGAAAPHADNPMTAAPSAWRRAPLFVARIESPQRPLPDRALVAPADASSKLSNRNGLVAKPRPAGLFVDRYEMANVR